MKDKLKLTALVAAMLLLATKEEHYAVALDELIVTGVGQPEKGLPLSVAKCQSFTSTGLVTPVSGKVPAAAVPSVLAGAATTGNLSLPAAGVASIFDHAAAPGPAAYAEVKSAGLKAAALASKEVRALRRDHINVRRAARGSAPAAPSAENWPAPQGPCIDPSSHGLHAQLPPTPNSIRPPSTWLAHASSCTPTPLAPAI